jgi:hypothetical protein
MVVTEFSNQLLPKWYGRQHVVKNKLNLNGAGKHDQHHSKGLMPSPTRDGKGGFRALRDALEQLAKLQLRCIWGISAPFSGGLNGKSAILSGRVVPMFSQKREPG